MMERLAAQEGPTGGKILAALDGEAPKHVVFVQCAGSRDENHLAYCSGVCCLASLKQATYVREQLPEAKVTICFIDIRTPDRLEDFYTKVQADEGVSFIKSKIADIAAKEGGRLLLNGEDTIAGKRLRDRGRPGGPGHGHRAQQAGARSPPTTTASPCPSRAAASTPRAA